MSPSLDEMIALFEQANSEFVKDEAENIASGVSERNLCGCMMLKLRRGLDQSPYADYFVDVEYNRNESGRLKTYVWGKLAPITITCDLIVHSRGRNLIQDNLIAIEMKRHNHPKEAKDSDKLRLKCLTRDSFDDIWSFDGKSLPEHVCRYILGVYYELNSEKRQVAVRYYVKGAMLREYTLKF